MKFAMLAYSVRYWWIV